MLTRENLGNVTVWLVNASGWLGGSGRSYVVGVTQLSLSVLPFVLQRRHLRQFAEGEVEVALVTEDHLLARFHNGFLCPSQEHLSLGDAEVVKISEEILSVHLYE